MTRRLTRDIFMTKDAIWDDMLPLLLILSRCELGSWNKFISWNFLYLGTFLWQKTLYKTIFCCFYWVRLCLELTLSHEKKLCKSEIYLVFGAGLTLTIVSTLGFVILTSTWHFTSIPLLDSYVTIGIMKTCFTSRVRER